MKNYSVREKVLLQLLDKTAPVHYHLCYKRRAWGLSSNDLVKFPEGILGHTLGKFYVTYGFEPYPKGERHDVFHVLLNYSTAVKDEAAMQFFLLGNGKPSLFTCGTAIVSGIFFPTQWAFYYRAFQRGKSARNISAWDFKTLLNENTEVLKQKIFNPSL